MTSTPPLPRVKAERNGDAWVVVDVGTGRVLRTFEPGARGAATAAEAVLELNRRRVSVESELRTWRRVHGWTQAELAERLGVQPLTVLRWESGQIGQPPYLSLALERLAQLQKDS